MGNVVPIRRRRVVKPAEGPSSHPVSVRVSASVFRRMTEMVESADYPEFKTKSDMIAEGIDLLFQAYESRTPDDPRWTPYRLHREIAAREQRDSDFLLIAERFTQLRQEGDRAGIARLLVDIRRLDTWFLTEHASDFEMNKLHALADQIELAVV